MRPATPQSRARRRWSDLGGAERVALYTRQSLYLVLVLFTGSVLLAEAFRLEDHGGRVAGLLGGGAVVVVLGVVTMRAVLLRHPVAHPLPWAALGPLAVASAAYVTVAATAWSGETRGSAVVVVVVSVVLPLAVVPDDRLAAGLVVAGGVLLGAMGGEAVNALAGVAIAAGCIFTSRASMWVLGIVAELDDARDAQAQLAVAEERLRFSRDVHDVLGRRLSAIAVQAELAATLAARGDERAAEQMLEVRAVAHEALREARELARGYRSTDVSQELEGARALLRSAGIDVRLDVADVPRAWQEAAGWVVRESVTNVLRHSDAATVEIAYADGRLRVANDGARPGAGPDGSGLRGLRERLAPLGATLVAEPDGAGGWVVIATLPGTGPLSARLEP